MKSIHTTSHKKYRGKKIRQNKKVEAITEKKITSKKGAIRCLADFSRARIETGCNKIFSQGIQRNNLPT